MNGCKYFIVCVLVSFSLFSRQPLANINSKDISLVRVFKKDSSYIHFIMIDGKHFLVKQKKRTGGTIGLPAVREALAAYVAEEFVGLAHQVDIIPRGKKIVGKIWIDCPATLHTVVSGVMVKNGKTPYEGLRIRQEDVGFNRTMLAWMAKHPTLITIVALDTFIGNSDRHSGNIFYNQSDDSFCAIDMESAFKRNFCAWACDNFSEIISDRSPGLTVDEIKVLFKYVTVLKRLINKYSPATIIKKYNHLCKKADIGHSSRYLTEKFKIKIERDQNIIQQSYQDAQRLVVILTEIIALSVKSIKK